MRAYLIDVEAQNIQEIEYRETKDLQAAVGGWIEIAYQWRNGEVCYVNEEGFFLPQTGGFFLAGRIDQPLVGNGIVVGKELLDEDGDYITTLSPSFTLEDLRKWVQFLDRAQLDAWGKANASEPSATLTVTDKDGKPSTEVLSRWGEIFRNMPRPEGEKE